MRPSPVSVALALVLGAAPLGCNRSETPPASKSDSGAAPAAEPELRAGPVSYGQWVGSITVPGSDGLEWAVAIGPADADADADADATAKLWIPAQMVSGADLGAPRVGADGSMTVELEAVGATWRIHPGAAPTCEFEQRKVALPCTVTSAKFEDFAKIAEPPRPQTPAPPFPYASEELKIDNPQAEGVTLAATLTLPAGEGPHPVAVLITGSGLQDRDETIAGHKPFLLIADALTRAGVAVLRYDDRGYAESTGDPSQATLEDFATDAWAAAQAAAAHPKTDPERVGLIGHSEGALIGPLVATQHPDAIDFVVLLAGPGVPGTEIIIHQQALLLAAQGVDQEVIARAEVEARKLHAAVLDNPPERAATLLDELLRSAVDESSAPPSEATDAAIAAQIETLNSPWFRHFLAWDPAPVLAKLEVPTLVMIGDMDLQVDVEQNLSPVRAALAANAKSEFMLLPGLNHLFQPAQKGTPDEYGMIELTMEPAVLDELARWIGVTTGLTDPEGGADAE